MTNEEGNEQGGDAKEGVGEDDGFDVHEVGAQDVDDPPIRVAKDPGAPGVEEIQKQGNRSTEELNEVLHGSCTKDAKDIELGESYWISGGRLPLWELWRGRGIGKRLIRR